MDVVKMQFFTYGICVTFYSLMAWRFGHVKGGRVERIISVLMAVIAAQYVKDIFFVNMPGIEDGFTGRVATALDFITVPFYGMLLFELCRPGRLTLRGAALNVSPFVVYSLVYVAGGWPTMFNLMLVLAALYGLRCIWWTLRALPAYHRYLKNEYSYSENINLYWLRGVMVMFAMLLVVWVYSCANPVPYAEILYMLFSLAVWVVVCYFIHRQERVLYMVRENMLTATPQPACTAPPLGDNQAARLKSLFDDDKVYLEPKLSLTELARQMGTNRTYLSQHINKVYGQTFYEFVNFYRVVHSERLLADTDYNLETVAEMSGFNSLSTFRRAFATSHGCSPQVYRDKNSTVNGNGEVYEKTKA